MGSVLNPQLFLLEDLFEIEEEAPLPAKVSVWMQDKDIVRASTNVTLLKKINPGIYTVEFDKNVGLFCRALDVKSDELFLFSDSITQKL